MTEEQIEELKRLALLAPLSFDPDDYVNQAAKGLLAAIKEIERLRAIIKGTIVDLEMAPYEDAEWMRERARATRNALAGEAVPE